MTFLVKDIRDQLTASTAILDAFSDRIFPDSIPQELRDSEGNRRTLYPAIVIGEISAQPEYDLGGESGVHTTQLQLDVYTDGTGGRPKANELSELVRNRLSGYRGQFGTGCSGTCRLIRVPTTIEAPTDASDNKRYRVSMDFEIIHTAAVPDLT